MDITFREGLCDDMKRKVMMLVGIMTILIAMLLLSGTATADSGTFHGMDWDLTDGVLTLGNGGNQTFTSPVTGIQKADWPWHNVRSSITAVECDGLIAFNGSLQAMFYDCTNITSIDLSGWNTNGVTDMRSLFRQCSSLSVIDVSNFDMSNVIKADYIFTNCISVTELPVSNWNTSSITSMNCLFYGCKKVSSLNLMNWDTENVTSMSSMFQDCSGLESLDLSAFDTSNVNDMSFMFAGCSSIVALTLSDRFDTSTVINMYEMFRGCSSLVTLDLSNFDTSMVTNMQSMFSECSSLTLLNVSSFDTSLVTSMSDMFYKCSNLSELNVSNFNTGRVIYIGRMFGACYNLTELDLSNFDTGNATNFSAMFYEDTKLETLKISGWDTKNVTDMGSMFFRCYKLNNIDVSGWNTAKVTNMGSMFESCFALTELDVSGWDTSSVVSMYKMFYQCQNLDSLNVANWNMGNVRTLNYMFFSCVKLHDLDVSRWDTSNFNGVYDMFYSCYGVKDLDVSNWNTSKITDTYQMFAYSGITELDVSGWDVSHFQRTKEMFAGCSHLQSMDLSEWNTENLTDIEGMFFRCSDLKTLNLSGLNVSRVIKMEKVFSGCLLLSELILGPNPFIGDGVSTVLPNYTTIVNGVEYTGKWIREDRVYGPYTPEELRDNYTSAMAGKWVWEKVPTEYSITFVCNEDGYLGDMPPVTVVAAEDYMLPGNAFKVFGYEFDHWTDGTRCIWMDKDIIPANTYAVNAEVTLTAVFEPRDRSIIMQDGAFDFSIKADEKALFNPVPASTAYQVYEQTPFGWNLIAQTDTSGIVMPDEESEALFLNKYDPLKVTVRLAGTKLMDGSAAEVDSFNFLLYEDDILIDIVSVVDGGLIEFQPITYEQAGAHHYYIREAVGNDATVSYDTHVEEITVEIVSDGAGHLYADVAMDEDEILFENASKPGYLVLSKANAVDGSRTGTFLYEVQFTTENGQPYELFSSNITYEERDEEISELPIGQPIEKPKYTLNLQHLAKTSGNTLSEQYYDTEEHNGGEVVIISARDISTGYNDRQYILTSVDNDFVRALDGTWKGVMPNRDLEVHLVYEQYADFVFQTRWTGDVSAERPNIDAILYANGEQYRVAEGIHVDDTYIFDQCPVLDSVGHYIEYTLEVPDMEGYYIVGRKNGTYSAYRNMTYGFNGDIIWDDMNDVYGLRPNELCIQFHQHLTSYETHYGDRYGGWHYGHEFYYDPEVYPVRVTIKDCPAVYEVITPDQDNTLDKYDLKLKLRNEATIDGAKWTAKVNGTGNVSELPLRSATSFTRNVVYTSVDDLPEQAVKIDDGKTAYSIYFWNDGTDCYWWSNAETVYMCSNLNRMFYKCSSLTDLDLSDFDTSKATTMSEMFVGCSQLTTINMSMFDTSSVISMYQMFASCQSLYDVDLSSFDTSNVTNMSYMFSGCYALETIDVSGFDLSKVTTLQGMFYYCKGLLNFEWSDTIAPVLTTMANMFLHCDSLQSIDLHGFDVSHVKDMGSLVEYCGSLVEINMSGWDTSSLENTLYMFVGCDGLISLDLSGWNTDHLTTIARTGYSVGGMFENCSHIEEINLSGWNLSNVTCLSHLFGGCSSLVSINMSGWDTSNVTSMDGVFKGCSSLSNLDLSAWNTECVNSLYGIFQDCTSLTSVDVSTWNTSNVALFAYAFKGCNALNTVDVSRWNTICGTNFNDMFDQCNSLSVIDVSGWQVDSATDMMNMFTGCSSVTVLDFSNWNTQNMTGSVQRMLASCGNLETVYVSDLWDLSNVSGSHMMLAHCNNLVGGAGTRYSDAHWDATYARIDNPPDEPGYFTYKVVPIQP